MKYKDTGMGVAEDKLNNLFKLEKGPSRLGTAQKKVTGLMLVLVKELVEANGGSIDITSHPDVGTFFLLRFPN